mmetsp:Transcript_7152/g.22098  ORF Transcript_7152/g.22098 Transcript_7152/m.22098 type:complete len:256 (+) Transcript_7152:890-1657(+)
MPSSSGGGRTECPQLDGRKAQLTLRPLTVQKRIWRKRLLQVRLGSQWVTSTPLFQDGRAGERRKRLDRHNLFFWAVGCKQGATPSGRLATVTLPRWNTSVHWVFASTHGRPSSASLPDIEARRAVLPALSLVMDVRKGKMSRTMVPLRSTRIPPFPPLMTLSVLELATTLLAWNKPGGGSQLARSVRSGKGMDAMQPFSWRKSCRGQRNIAHPQSTSSAPQCCSCAARWQLWQQALALCMAHYCKRHERAHTSWS